MIRSEPEIDSPRRCAPSARRVAMITGSGVEAADDAAQIVAEVRADRPLAGSVLPPTPTRLVAAVDGIGTMKDVLPECYPIQEARVEELITSENKLGRMVDYGVIAARVDALYSPSARALGEPLLLDLIVDGAPAYAWPADQHHVWKSQPRRRLISLIEFLTRPHKSHIRLELATA